jgi:hypothetical protein
MNDVANDPTRAGTIVLIHSWEEVADYALDWASANAKARQTVSAGQPREGS